MLKSATAFALLLLSLLSGSVAAQEKVVLSYKAKAGQTARYRGEAQLVVEVQGMKINYQAREVEKVTYKEVAANGNITSESETESAEVMINGRQLPSNETPRKSVSVIRPDGNLISYSNSQNNPENNKSQVRINSASIIRFSSKPVGVGDKWSVDILEDGNLGVRPARAEYEILGFEKVNNIDCVKIKSLFKESGDKPITANGTSWIEKSSGDTVREELMMENVQLDAQAIASGTVREERIEGSPLGDAQATAVKPEPKKDKTIDETIKDFDKIPGLFMLYRKKDQGRETVYMEVHEDQVDKLFMLEVTAGSGSSGRIVAGNPINDLLLKFVKTADDRLFLSTPNTNFRANPDSPIARAIKRSYPDGILESFRIEAKQPERKGLLINITELFRGDIAQLSAIMSGRFGGAPFSLDRDKTMIGAWKNFPDNMVIETNYHFSGQGLPGTPTQGFGGRGSDQLADDRSFPLKVVYNLFPVVENGFKPRLADPRVGYFLTEFQSYDYDDLPDTKVRYILRWNLEKADPNAAMSPPKKPIVYWMDNAIPMEYREAVREGLLMWNKAFEKVGIKDAIVVKQMPDDADWDHADMRFNTIRWVTSPDSGYAVALFRANPLTGEILNAHITVDANFTRAIKQERRFQVNPASYFEDHKHPEGHAHDPRKCELGEGMMEQAWFGYSALSLLAQPGTKIDDKEYTRSYLREVVGHEMGHILGLRHNFIASTQYDEKQLKNGKLLAENGVVASIMDYAPFNIFAIKTPGVDYFSRVIGAYDMWAIEYGYTPISSSTPSGERFALNQIASRCNQPGLAFQSDEIADNWDPGVVRFDLGKDPLAYYEKRMNVAKHILLNLDKKMPEKGNNYADYAREFNRMNNIYFSSAANTVRFIGGLRANRNHKGDPGEKPVLVPVDAAQQRRALQLVTDYLFSESAFKIPSSVYLKLAENPFQQQGNSAPVFDTISGGQKAALRRLFSPQILGRIVNNEYKMADSPNKFALTTVFNMVRQSVWSELATGKNIGALHRDLQRAHLDVMAGMMFTAQAGMPEDARMLAWNELRTLKGSITAAKGRPTDTYTRIHLDRSLEYINRALDVKLSVTVNPSAPTGGILLGTTPAEKR